MMGRNATLLASLFIGTILASACQSSKEKSEENFDPATDTTWAILPFNKVDSFNPILVPRDAQFLCPVLGQPVKWEEKDVFNPAAVVRKGKVYLLFRAETKSANTPAHPASDWRSVKTGDIL